MGEACLTFLSFCFLFGDLVPGPYGSIPGPGEGLLKGFWTPEKKTETIVFRAQRAPTEGLHGRIGAD